MGITRNGHHKRSATGAKRAFFRKKRKFELGRQPSNTKLGDNCVKRVRVRGGHHKQRAIRLNTGNFAWGSEAITRKTRVLDVVYNSTSNELVRTKTLVKSAIVQIDATPYRQWWEGHYGQLLGRTALTDNETAVIKTDEKSAKEYEKKAKHAVVAKPLLDLFPTGRLYAKIQSRPGQTGRCDGYILEGKELEFYSKKLKSKK